LTNKLNSNVWILEKLMTIKVAMIGMDNNIQQPHVPNGIRKGRCTMLEGEGKKRGQKSVSKNHNGTE
jgi:hypothetical protein